MSADEPEAEPDVNAMREVLAPFLEVAKRRKDALAHSEGAAVTLRPHLTLYKDGRPLGCAYVPEAGHEQWFPFIQGAIAASDATVASFTIESYVLVTAAEHDAGEPLVADAMVCAVATTDGYALMAAPFRRAGREVLWGSTIISEARVARDLLDALRKGFEEQAERTSPALSVRDIGERFSTLVEYPTPPPRNRPCPCGSGIKAKSCCWASN